MSEPVKDSQPVRSRAVITSWLHEMRINDTLRFSASIKDSSVRAIASRMGIRVSCERLEDGQLRVTRKS